MPSSTPVGPRRRRPWSGATQIKENLDAARSELEAARRAGDLTRMSELQYGEIPALEKALLEAEAQEQSDHQLVRNKVAEEEIAEVVAKWTGVPVSKLLEGEREKLLRPRRGAAGAGHRSGRSGGRRGQRRTPQPGRALRTPRGLMDRSSS